ncbi:MAG: T9SS type A sorting domain-containing protein [Bacteroidia bacterium]|nr:T9SS type A sorting domain-containing protein [Bacteroidia bacterium]
MKTKTLLTILGISFILIAKAQVTILNTFVSYPLVNNTYALSSDAAGNLYTIDPLYLNILKISPSGSVTTFATGYSGIDLTVDLSGNVYVLQSYTGSASATIYKFNSSGVLIPFVTLYNYSPTSIVIDAAGTIYYASDNAINKITSSGVISAFVGNPVSPGYMDGVGSAAKFNYISGMVIDGVGDLYVVDNGNNCIRRVTSTGTVTTLAGDPIAGNIDGLGTAARFSNPQDIAIDGLGNMYVTELSNMKIRKVTPIGNVTTMQVYYQNILTTQVQNAYGIVCDQSGNIIVDIANSSNSKIIKSSTANSVVQTKVANSITSTSANVTGLINAVGNTTSTGFEYGLTTAYGASISATPSVANGTLNVNINAALNGLSAGTVYHYRCIGSNTLGIEYGADMTFTTSSIATGVSKLIDNNSIIIYPNPASAYLNISGLDKKQHTVVLISMFGEVIRTIETDNKEFISINIENLSSGVYFIKVNDKCTKFIKE